MPNPNDVFIAYLQTQTSFKLVSINVYLFSREFFPLFQLQKIS